MSDLVWGARDIGKARRPAPPPTPPMEPARPSAFAAAIARVEFDEAGLGAPMSAADRRETAFAAGAVRALRRRAMLLRAKAAEQTAPADGFPDVAIRSPEAAHAARVAADFDQIADELERGAR